MLNNITKNAILIVLCLADANRKMTKEEICEESGVLPNYFGATMRVLVDAHIVKSIRGHVGGYEFIGDINKLTLYDIYALYQKTFDAEECLVADHKCTEQDISECLCKQAMIKAMDAMYAEMKKATLNQLLDIKQLSVIKHHNEKYSKK